MDLRHKALYKHGSIFTKFMGIAASAAMTLTTLVATAFAGGTGTLAPIFDKTNELASNLQVGLTSVVVAIAVPVGIWFLVRMLTASDAKDITMYKKRLIMTAVIVVVAFVLPGFIQLCKTIGESIHF